jgi:transcription elongation factor GreA
LRAGLEGPSRDPPETVANSHALVFGVPDRSSLDTAGRSQEVLSNLKVERMDRIPMTASGYKALEDEISHLKLVERPAVIKMIAEARSHGDLSENAEYHAAKERQAFIEGRVMDLEDKLSRAEIIDVSKLSGKTVKFGAIVTLSDEDTDAKVKYQIVGDLEADAKKGKISISSPIARALIGKTAGDTVEVSAPGGARSYEILKVQFA